MALFVIVTAVYLPVAHFDFVNYDDPDYVTSNSHVLKGITWNGLAWAVTSPEAANWFPLTRISHMADVQLFGLQSGAHHMVNVFFHACSVVLLFLFLKRATHAQWTSAVVALLFGLHPLHVESVAWVAERKDVLSTFFWFLGLYAYLRYAQRPAIFRYGLVILTFCFGLMAKPMMVSFPFVLLLMDVWPLKRLTFGIKRLVLEKLPLFALSTAVCVVTYLVQEHAGAVKSAAFPLSLRLGNGLVSYLTYIVQTLWPVGLAVFYPHPLSIPIWELILASFVLAAISLIAIRQFRRRPYLAVGWFWYLGTLAPVIGLIQAGSQAHADRYMYVPMVGLLFIFGWGCKELVERWPGIKPVAIGLAAASCAACAVATSGQLEYWANSEALFRHALAVTGPSYVAEHNLGSYLLEIPDRRPEAIQHLRAALRLNPDSVEAHTDLGSALSKEPGRLPEAIREFKTALRLDPDSAITENDFANTLSRIPGRLSEAISHYEAALRLNLDFAEAHNNLGGAYMAMGRKSDGIAEFQTALRLKPGYENARRNLQMAEAEPSNSGQDQVSQLEAAVQANPNSARMHTELGNALVRVPERLLEGIAQYEAALKIEPHSAEAQNNLGVALSHIPARREGALEHFAEAVKSNPDYPDAQFNLAIALANAGKLREAIQHMEAGLRLRPDPRMNQALAQMRAALKQRAGN